MSPSTSKHADAIRILRNLTDENSRPITLHIGYSKQIAAAADALEALANEPSAALLRVAEACEECATALVDGMPSADDESHAAAMHFTAKTLSAHARAIRAGRVTVKEETNGA